MKWKWLPVIDAGKCTGCNLCVEACGPACLEIAEGIAALPGPNECGSEEHCIAACRDDAIRMQWVPFTGNESVGCWSSDPLTIPIPRLPEECNQNSTPQSGAQLK